MGRGYFWRSQATWSVRQKPRLYWEISFKLRYTSRVLCLYYDWNYQTSSDEARGCGTCGNWLVAKSVGVDEMCIPGRPPYGIFRYGIDLFTYGHWSTEEIWFPELFLDRMDRQKLSCCSWFWGRLQRLALIPYLDRIVQENSIWGYRSCMECITEWFRPRDRPECYMLWRAASYRLKRKALFRILNSAEKANTRTLLWVANSAILFTTVLDISGSFTRSTIFTRLSS